MQLTIEKLIYGGDGLSRLPADEGGRGKAVFVPFVLEDETADVTLIEQKPGFARGRAEKILVPSPQRVEAGCPYFVRCGGCHYQHSIYSHQLEIKAAILRENLRRIAKLELGVELQIHSSPEWNYRNRSRFAVKYEPDFGLCYRKFNSHELFPVEECPISSALINKALKALWRMGRAKEIPVGIREVELFANADDSKLLVEISCEEDADKASLEQWLKECGGELPLSGDDLTYETEQASYRVSAGSFFQTNRFLTNQLVNIVTSDCAGKLALDLYAGVGLFSWVLSRDFHSVIAVESSPSSFADLAYNSPANVKATHASTERFLHSAAGKIQPDLVIVDPPRAGLGGKVLAALSAMRAPRLIYVSCDPATVARDLRELLSSGYKLQAAHLIDLFPQTFHIESVFHLSR